MHIRSEKQTGRVIERNKFEALRLVCQRERERPLLKCPILLCCYGLASTAVLVRNNTIIFTTAGALGKWGWFQAIFSNKDRFVFAGLVCFTPARLKDGMGINQAERCQYSTDLRAWQR